MKRHASRMHAGVARSLSIHRIEALRAQTIADIKAALPEVAVEDVVAPLTLGGNNSERRETLTMVLAARVARTISRILRNSTTRRPFRLAALQPAAAKEQPTYTVPVDVAKSSLRNAYLKPVFAENSALTGASHDRRQ